MARMRVVGGRAGRTTPAMTCGHSIPSSAEEGSMIHRRGFLAPRRLEG
jgi:hypothetical protein